MSERKTISRPEMISLKEFKERINNADGFGKTRRILLYGWDAANYRYKYRIAMIGRKDACIKEAYRLLFLEPSEEERLFWIQEGEFQIPISFNFSGAKLVN